MDLLLGRMAEEGEVRMREILCRAEMGELWEVSRANPE
jgi:hypothetical protein